MLKTLPLKKLRDGIKVLFYPKMSYIPHTSVSFASFNIPRTWCGGGGQENISICSLPALKTL
jgi:hypothetical protein